MPPAQRRTARPASQPAAVEAPPAPATPARAIRPAAARARAAQAEEVVPVRSTHTSAYGNETIQDEPLDDVRFPPGVEPSFVKVTAGKTISLGNFEFLRIDVSITRACLRKDEDQTFLDIADSVADKLGQEEMEWLGSTPKKSKR